ncbi:MAG: hypothetical protein GX493_00330 [Firmicutes bacterium]|nr:hypothetical protein [Bacillota bacterium]
MTVSPLNARHYLLHMECAACAGGHVWRLGRREFWQPRLYRFYCPKTEKEIGYLGAEEAVLAAIGPGEDKDEPDFTGYFTRPEVMFQVLGHLKSLAERENLVCQCGNRRIEVKVFPDKLELRCISCHSLLLIYAETQEDLMAVKKMPRIVMSERGFASIDASRKTQNR